MAKTHIIGKFNRIEFKISANDLISFRYVFTELTKCAIRDCFVTNLNVRLYKTMVLFMYIFFINIASPQEQGH